MKFLTCLTRSLASLIFVFQSGVLAQTDTTIEDHHYQIPPVRVPYRVVASEIPFVVLTRHDVGNIVLTMTNAGVFGPDINSGSGLNTLLEFMEHPKSIRNAYPTPRLWLGGVYKRDTLVTTMLEFWPAPEASQLAHDEQFRERSINDTGASAFFANSEQDLTCVYYDTLTNPLFVSPDELDTRPHRPLNLKVRQTSYAWSYEFAHNFIIIDYQITNIGNDIIHDAYAGVFVEGGYAYGILTGYIPTAPAYNINPVSCSFEDQVDIFWFADNDGDPQIVLGSPAFSPRSPTSVLGITILNKPKTALTLSYNWWNDNVVAAPGDWGPRRLGTPDKPFRNFGGWLGTPFGDRLRYYVMSSGEIDYDQIFAGLDNSADGWLPPPSDGMAIAEGPQCGDHNHRRTLISTGPFDFHVGETIPFTIAYVMGEGFHIDPVKTSIAANPQAFLDRVNFDDLYKNTAWARWVYDNPGVDTDNDGYFGEIRVCPETVDSFFYTGDSVADLRAATPPPAPTVRFTPTLGQVTLEWNGLRSETTPDIFTKEIDFEGYRVYVGLVNRHGDLTVNISYDIEDYTQMYFNPDLGTEGRWITIRKPFSLEEVQDAYAGGNRDYDPLFNGFDNPFRVGDSLFHFITQDFNQSDLTLPDGIQKIYPNEPYPHTVSLDSAFSSELTPEGDFKYFEYRYVVRQLLPSLKYYISVTAFDFGSQGTQLPFLETNPTTNSVEVIPLNRVPQGDELNVIVYPNPYRVDGNYREEGFEGRGKETFTDERTRELQFINLPPRCTIAIYTLDGDMVIELDHDAPPSSATSMRESWDLITRNSQLPVSGIYYFLVETPEGQSQLGKFVLIM